MRLLVEPFRGDRADAERLAATFTALHALLGTRRTLALEVHLDRRAGGSPLAWFAVVCPAGLERQVQAALRRGYPNVRLRPLSTGPAPPPVALALRRLRPPRAADEPPEGEIRIEPLLLAMAATGAPATVRLLLAPAARLVELALSDAEHPSGPLLWAQPIVLAGDRGRARAIASVLAAGSPRLVARRLGHAERERPPRAPSLLYRPAELARLWSLPAPEFAGVPCVRRAIPLAPAPPGVSRARPGQGLLVDDHGAVTIAEPMRRQHVAVVGAVEQGKTSFLVASVAEDLRREDCAVIVLDPKGDAAAAVLSIVPPSRTCTLLDMAAPTSGFNPLAVDAAPDAIADHVVAALRGLFSEGEVRGSSDRYLRNALIAVLACGGRPTLWDVARLLEIGEGGRTFRARVGERLVELPAYAELATFFADELPAQLADARATTTAKLDAPANKLARVLNSPAVKRVLLNDSLSVDLDRLIERREVLVVRGALGEIGAGNVAVLMQLLLGMLDAALGRRQDRHAADRRGSVALKIDEAPLVINAAFAQTLALKRAAGLETVACWQADAQWEPELRDQLDALFAHRVLFATASAADARAASSLLLSEYSDQLRAGDEQIAALASPDVRLHLPRHAALASWTTARGRERPFIGATIPLPLDSDRIAAHAAAQQARGARPLADPRPPPPSVGIASPAGDGAALPVARAVPPVARVVPPVAPFVAPAAVERTPGRRSPPAGERGARPSPAAPAARPDPPPVPAEPPAVQSPPTAAPPAVQSPDAIAAPPLAPARSPATAQAASYAELLAFDFAAKARWLPVGRARARPTLTPPDRDLLDWLVAARCALTSQIHRRVNPDRSLTTTQRALKRLSDQGLIARFQLHRDDGGGVPQCCAVTEAGLVALGIEGRRAPELREERLESLRRDIHVVGWLLALEAAAGDAVRELLGPGRAALVPGSPRPADLRLEQALRPREFLVTAPDGSRVAVERFAPVRPDAAIDLAAGGRRRDLLVAFDGPAPAAAIEAYDHLLAGWWRTVDRYRRRGEPPQVVVVCADESTTHARVALADRLLTSCLAEIGAPPAAWQRPGRALIRFVAEQDLHERDACAWAVPPLPPGLRPEYDCTPVRVELAPSPRRRDPATAKARWR